ncbi:hypothetical protein Scep_021744 [Stephania cephalantha]|uniref:Uncharacterized protein n=1 Tax=Stephania cephalantha TaxID=152367 RepID=A0AAP0F6K6_9MAGN
MIGWHSILVPEDKKGRGCMCFLEALRGEVVQPGLARQQTEEPSMTQMERIGRVYTKEDVPTLEKSAHPVQARAREQPCWETATIVFKATLEVTWNLIEQVIAVTIEHWIETLPIVEDSAMLICQDLEELENILSGETREEHGAEVERLGSTIAGGGQHNQQVKDIKRYQRDIGGYSKGTNNYAKGTTSGHLVGNADKNLLCKKEKGRMGNTHFRVFFQN